MDSGHCCLQTSIVKVRLTLIKLSRDCCVLPVRALTCRWFFALQETTSWDVDDLSLSFFWVARQVPPRSLCPVGLVIYGTHGVPKKDVQQFSLDQ